MNTPPSSSLPDCVLYDLSHLGLIHVEGEDALSFMQGQFTNDSREIGPHRSQLSALCSPKGRMLALFRVIPAAKGWLLQLPSERLEPLRQRLQMHVLRAKVSLRDASADWRQMGLAGAGAEALLQQLLGQVPEGVDDCIQQEGLCCLRLMGSLAENPAENRPRFLLLADPQQAAGLWQRLSEAARPGDVESWKLLAIRAGEPVVHEATVEAFVPQMANLQLVNGLSFTKGCFTGQEVVARMQYLGKLKRRMYRARLASAEPVLPGMEIFSPHSTSGQGAGRVVEAAASEADGQWELLAVLEISQADGPLHLASLSGPELKILPLPYAFEEKST
ncbi:folate-binding protein YgfZ [Magnetovirga frankeli]|uniref:CAF17-like 4Fe-4S cluster assembly/insertion protein YgfZ n=1 Tax=Magnetovirga frankeli TaxID=947516 RepID=UPI001292FBAF|nr:folate-binding protein YgfZ [gamma proteobacterium SS-5]